MYWSAEDFVEVPPAVDTVTSTMPADSAGAVAVMLLSELIVKLAGSPEPKSPGLRR